MEECKHAILLIGHGESGKSKTIDLLIDKMKTLSLVHTTHTSTLFSLDNKKIAIFNGALWKITRHSYGVPLPIVSLEELRQYDVIVATTFYKGFEKDSTVKGLEAIGFHVHIVKKNHIDGDEIYGVANSNMVESELANINNLYHEADANYLFSIVKLTSGQMRKKTDRHVSTIVLIPHKCILEGMKVIHSNVMSMTPP